MPETKWQPSTEEIDGGTIIDQVLDVLWDTKNHALFLRCRVRDPSGAEPTESIVLLPMRTIRQLGQSFQNFAPQIADAIEQRRRN